MVKWRRARERSSEIADTMQLTQMRRQGRVFLTKRIERSRRAGGWAAKEISVKFQCRLKAGVRILIRSGHKRATRAGVNRRKSRSSSLGNWVLVHRMRLAWISTA